MSQTFCSQCGQRLLEGDAYCDICGKPVAGHDVAPAGPSTPDVSSPEPLARVQARPVVALSATDSPAPVPAVSPPGRRRVFPWVLASAGLVLGLALIWMGVGRSGWSSPGPATFSPGMTSSASEPQGPAPTATPGVPLSRLEPSPTRDGVEPAPTTRFEVPIPADPGGGQFVEPAREDPRAEQRDAREMLEKYYELIDSDRFDQAYVMRSWRSRNEVPFDQFLKIWSNNRSIRLDDFSVVAAKPDRLQVRVRLNVDDIDARTGHAQFTRYRGTVSLVFEEGAWRYNGGEFASER